MILVDSCVWIDLLRGKSTRGTDRLRHIRETLESEIVVSSVVYFEVLRGIVSDGERRKVQKALDLLQRKDPLPEGYSELASLYRQAQKIGVTVSKLGDWLILKTVLDHHLTLLTTDKDFYRLSEAIDFSMEI